MPPAWVHPLRVLYCDGMERVFSQESDRLLLCSVAVADRSRHHCDSVGLGCAGEPLFAVWDVLRATRDFRVIRDCGRVTAAGERSRAAACTGWRDCGHHAVLTADGPLWMALPRGTF